MQYMIIKNAKNSDKEKILDFCQKTFSWGDYIAEVWDFWIKEGNLLVSYIDENPIGICHASINEATNQVWIEGIRIHPCFRRQGIAKKLVLESENIGKKRGCKNSFMLIDVDNSNSLNLASKIGYKKNDVWIFYQLEPQKITSTKIKFLKETDDLSQLYSKNYLYVDSWRWYPLDKHSILSLIKNNRIISTDDKDPLSVFSVLNYSQHFDKTLLVTIHNGNSSDLKKILQFLQNYGHEKKLKRIQILTKLDSLPNMDCLKKRLLFYLMKKELV